MYGQFMTDRGQLRSTNEDAGGIFTNKSGQLLAIVADGMGGHLAGEVASELAVVAVKKEWESTAEVATPIEAEKWLETIMAITNKQIYEAAKRRTEYDGMGTTVVISICTEEFVTIAHIGDSRCYIMNETNFEQLTDDHSLVNELVRSGEITEIDAEKHPRKNVLLKAVGTEEVVHADIQTINWEKDDRILLCSDGLTNKITDDELEHYLRNIAEVDEVVKEFIHIANERGGEDNITLAIVKREKHAQAGDATC